MKKDIYKFIARFMLILGVSLGTLLMTLAGLVGRQGLYASYPYSYAQEPLLSLSMRGLSDGIMPFSEAEYTALHGDPDAEADYQVLRGDEAERPSQLSVQPLFEEPVVAEPEDESDTKDAGQEPEEQEATDESSDGDEGGQEDEAVEAPVVEEPEEPEIYELESVTDDYFYGALFLGDSRTVGLSEYCAPLDERAQFYAKVSLTIFTLMDKEFITDADGVSISVDTALSREHYDKIYLMIGINEMGTGDTEYFYNAYAEVIDRIRALQPDAIIYIQSIMHVTEKKSSTERHINNTNIDLRNNAIATLANGHDIFYLDMNESVDGENGALREELTFDGVHLKAKSYELWYDYLRDHAVIRAQDEQYRRTDEEAAEGDEQESGTGTDNPWAE